MHAETGCVNMPLGKRTFGGGVHVAGIQVCGIVACHNYNGNLTADCLKNPKNRHQLSKYFRSIEIVGTFLPGLWICCFTYNL